MKGGRGIDLVLDESSFRDTRRTMTMNVEMEIWDYGCK